MSIAPFSNKKELVKFARAFLRDHVDAFRKDMAICMTPNVQTACVLSRTNYMHCICRSIKWPICRKSPAPRSEGTRAIRREVYESH
jgi:hypothetical protein